MGDALNWNRAATSADPAPGVAEAMVEGLLAVDPARGVGLAHARRDEVRRLAAQLFGFARPDHVVFTSGATYGLNQAVCALPDGAWVVASALEHNAALRPLDHARRAGRCTLRVAEPGADGRVTLARVAAAFADAPAHAPRWLFLALASNVLGTLQPIDELAAWCQKHGVDLVLDLSQGAGQVPVDLARWRPTYTAVAAHKGLHGPQGIGLLFVGEHAPLAPLVYGGTGRHGESLDPPTELPGCLEAGTPNMPGIYGLGAALAWRLEHPADLSAVRDELAWLESQLREDGRVELLPVDPPDWSERLPVLSLRPREFPPELLATQLAQDGVLVRSGMMCAALAAPSMGVEGQGGVVRLSPPEATTRADTERVLRAMQQALDLFASQP